METTIEAEVHAGAKQNEADILADAILDDVNTKPLTSDNNAQGDMYLRCLIVMINVYDFYSLLALFHVLISFFCNRPPI